MPKNTMTKIEIEIPDEIAFVKQKISTIEWSFLAMQILQDKIRKIARYNEILSKSKATEKDVEELSSEIKDAVWKRHSRYIK